MYLLLIFLSLIGSLLAGFFGKFLGSLGSIRITVFTVFCSFIISLIIFYEVALLKSTVFLELFFWIDSEVLNIKWSFMFDSLTVSMCVVVIFISFLVHLYSIEYMSNDPHISRFMSYLSLFTFFMLILITADNFVQMFIGWEGVGLCSYLLINFWFTRIQANKAAIKAMILNRVGDFSLVIGILFIFVNFKALDYQTVCTLTPFFKNNINNVLNFNLLNLIGFFLFIGAIGKSAQIGLHTWLPDAMEGPTPVSALIHAATMVTAGIFLVARVSFLYEHIFMILDVIILIGALTSFLASTTGLVQNDLKKVIAYSTCSQLGYMVFSCGLSNYSVGMFHLFNHAFFKALLFLSAGSIIHSINDEQDMRKMGGLRKFLPFTYSCMVIGSLALIGFPFLTGFYSKDLILEISFSKFNKLGYFSYILGTLGAFLTAFYSSRLLCLTFLSKPNGFKKIICHAHDSNFNIKFVLIMLSIPSIFIGYFCKDMIVGIGTTFFDNSIFINLTYYNLIDAEFIGLVYKTLPVYFSLLGFLTSFFSFIFWSNFLFKIKTNSFGKKIYIFFNRKWFFDKIYNDYLSQFFFKIGFSLSYKFIDRGFFELLGPTGLSFFSLKFGSILHKLQTYLLYHILLVILFFITLIFILKIILINLTNLFSFNIIFLNFIIILFFIKYNYI
jgi:NADH-ubiquinone oxidoreductase chain 5